MFNLQSSAAAALVALAAAGCADGQQRAPAAQSRPAAPVAHAAPLALDTETSCGLPAFRETLLRRINLERARRQQCGSATFQPAPPLVWNGKLFSAAAAHSADMARRNYFDHASPEGSRVGERVTAVGFPWRAVGENIAGGDVTVDAVMTGWMRSPAHCSNLMQPDFAEVGVACVRNPRSTWGTYWTMVLGKPR